MAKAGTYSRQKMAIPAASFESERLCLRPMNADDEAELWEMLSSAEVLEYIPLEPATDRQATKTQILADFAAGERFKFFFAVTWKSPAEDQSKDMIAWVLMRPMEDGKSMELGYWLLPEVWGMGVATEAATAVVTHCPPLMDFPKQDITAHVLIGNHASRNVLEKVGLEYTGEGQIELENKTVDVWGLAWPQE